MKRRTFISSAFASGLFAPALAQDIDTPPEFQTVERPNQPQPSAEPQSPANFENSPPPGTHVTESGEIIADLRYPVPKHIQPRFVNLTEDIPKGDIHIAPKGFSLYLGMGNMTAIEYPCGIGREGRYRSGTFRIARKVTWPSWTPTRNMIRREPEKYRQYAGGMPGGPENPLGARALYLHYLNGGGDTFLRIHGTPQPWTVVTASSSGCVRMINAHVIDLFDRVPTGTRVKLFGRDDDYDPSI